MVALLDAAEAQASEELLRGDIEVPDCELKHVDVELSGPVDHGERQLATRALPPCFVSNSDLVELHPPTRPREWGLGPLAVDGNDVADSMIGVINT